MMSAMPLNEFANKLEMIMPRLMNGFSRQHQNEFFRGKITLPQFVILSYLEKEGPVRMTDLALFMNVTTAAMTGIIARLVRLGYVRRQADPKDRRIIKVTLTAKGEQTIKKAHQERRQVILHVFGQISEMEREDYLRILMHIQEIVQQRAEDSK
jgi:DNA-binding MarR family transcriptional regulator